MKTDKLIVSVYAVLLALPVLALDDDEILLIEEDSQEELILGINEDDVLEFTEEQEESGELIVDREITDLPEEREISAEGDSSGFQIDALWAEYGHFTDSESISDSNGYLHGKSSFNWSDNDNWEVNVSARIDGYIEQGANNLDNVDVDYDETYVRYKTSNSIVTIGAQKVIWGRIDEFPPTDRLSTQDFRRFVIDDLEDRRLASVAFRYEHFLDTGKIDLVIYPDFREAELPDQQSIWFPVNRKKGTVLGLESTPMTKALIKNALIREKAPDSEGGFGLRYSSLGAEIDYGITLQKGRSTVPYFAYNPSINTIEGRYPRNLMIGGDVGFEALGGTLKFEGGWFSDTPITKSDGSYSTAESISWGVALEMFPGDGDARLNLQIVGQNLLGAPSTIDRQDIYTFNGSYEAPFADDNWRTRTRFYVGLDEKDIYLNPEITYTGLEAQEIYLELHLFDGDESTPGGFYQDNSVVALGWRAHF